MDSNKFDNNIKETLENRRLQPSMESWNKLSQRLDSQNKKQNNKAIWVIGAAASLAGLLFVAFQFFSTSEITPTITEIPMVKEQENTPIATENTKSPNTVLKETYPMETNELQKSITNKTSITNQQTLPKEIKPVEEVSKKTTFEAEKIETLVAKVNDLINNNQTVTDSYIETLLVQAQNEIKLEKFRNQKTGIVDASLLLQQVETDLDQSFRSKVFEAIKASYTTVKTVVAQRNN